MRAIVAHHGIQLGEVKFSVGVLARFRVSQIDATDVHLIDSLPAPYEPALRAWWEKERH